MSVYTMNFVRANPTRAPAGGRRRRQAVDPEQVASKQYVRKAIRRDKATDFVDIVPSNGAEVTATGTFTQLSNVAQGDGENQRIGDSLSVSGIRYTGLYAGESTNSASTIHIPRIVLFRWMPDNNTDAPSLSKMFEDTGDPQSHFIGDRTSRRKFKVIKDYNFVLASRQNSAGNAFMRLLRKKYIKINKKVYYNAGATTGKGQLYLLEWSGSATGNEGLYGNSMVRVFYKEL